MVGTLAELMAAVVAAGTERRFGRLIMLDDPLIVRLADRVDEAIAYGIAAGRQAAAATAGQYGRDPVAVAAALGVPVTQDEVEAKAGSSVLLSEYGDRPPGIVMHLASLRAAREMIEREGLAPLLGLSDPWPTHLAHELYHHLDAKRLTPGTSGFRVTTLHLGPLHLDSGLPSLSEVSADSFAQSLLSLAIHPKALHFLIIYQYNPEYAWQLLEKLRSLPQ
ncbi:MAG: hypothetical protein ACYC4L_10585 [Chloroflexota bacterium]